MKHTVECPIYIIMERKTMKDKKYSLNLNTYRNLHYRVNNILKHKFKEEMEEQILKLPEFNQISLEFVLYKGSNRRIDRHNFCSVVQKFFCDSLVELGKLPDDTDKYIIDEKYVTGGVDPDNPRCEVNIYS